MTWDEMTDFLAGLPKNWEFSRHEINALYRVTEHMSLEMAGHRASNFLARYEGRFKPSVKHLSYALAHDVEGETRDPNATPPPEPGNWVEVHPRYSEREYGGRHWGKLIPEAGAYAAYHFYFEHTDSTPEDRREAIKAYYLKRQDLNAPIFGKEEDGIRALLATCDAEILEEGEGHGAVKEDAGNNSGDVAVVSQGQEGERGRRDVGGVVGGEGNVEEDEPDEVEAVLAEAQPESQPELQPESDECESMLGPDQYALGKLASASAEEPAWTEADIPY